MDKSSPGWSNYSQVGRRAAGCSRQPCPAPLVACHASLEPTHRPAQSHHHQPPHNRLKAFYWPLFSYSCVTLQEELGSRVSPPSVPSCVAPPPRSPAACPPPFAANPACRTRCSPPPPPCKPSSTPPPSWPPSTARPRCSTRQQPGSRSWQSRSCCRAAGSRPAHRAEHAMLLLISPCRGATGAALAAQSRSRAAPHRPCPPLPPPPPQPPAPAPSQPRALALP